MPKFMAINTTVDQNFSLILPLNLATTEGTQLTHLGTMNVCAKRGVVCAEVIKSGPKWCTEQKQEHISMFSELAKREFSHTVLLIL